MTLKEYTNSLSKDKQFDLAINLTRLALPIWNNYINKIEPTYRDTVVGQTHQVDKRLLLETIDIIELRPQTENSNTKLSDLRRQYDDPIVALQDLDWKLPEDVQKTFYAVYNLLNAYLGKVSTAFGELTIYVSINQAVDALILSESLTFDDITKIVIVAQAGS